MPKLNKAGKRLVVGMIVRNEANRYLRKVLTSIQKYSVSGIHLSIIVVDDCSTDNTVEICESYPNIKILKLKKRLFDKDESKLRNILWEEIRKESPDHVLIQDADEIFDDSFHKRLPELLNLKYDWIAFRLCDMWSEDHYRIDGYWSPTFRRLFKFKNVPFGVMGKIHCSCIPQYIAESNNGTCFMDIRIKHLSWMDEKDRAIKIKRYSKIGMGGLNAKHLESVSLPPRLKKWKEKIELPKIKICILLKNDSWCMDKFFKALTNQDYPKEKLSLFFIENDSQDDSFQKIQDWGQKWKSHYRKIEIQSMKFNIPGQEHNWPDQTLFNMTLMRNSFLENIEDNDYILNIDSDVILTYPQTLKHLALSDRDIIAETFWARWNRYDGQLMPNVWPFGGYDGVSEDFMASLHNKGIFPVGGLGACNLVSKYAIKKGCCYDPVYNLPLQMRGEDRHFCIRAVVLGFTLWADSFFPPQHLEKFDYDLQFKFQEIRKKRAPGNRISLVMLVHDEDYLLENFLNRMAGLFDEIIIVDSGSVDDSRKVAQKFTDKVYSCKWNDNYAEIRNFAISKATCPWIFYADPDENYGVQKLEHFDKMVSVDNAIGYIFLVFNYRGDRPQPAISESVRLFRNIPEIKFTGLVHETLDETISKYLKTHSNLTLRLSPIPMYHWGFVKGTQNRKEKLAYYRKLNEKQLEENPKDCRPYYNLAMHYLEEDGNQVRGIELLKKSIELSPTFYQPRKELGIYYLREARNHFTTGTKLLPPTHPFHNFQKRAVQWISNFLGEGNVPQQQIQIESEEKKD